jgi:site-specific DNA-adenine methylase
MSRLRPFFSYFGAKWRASVSYPPPKYKTLIEPFAGSACYALLHHNREVVLFDKDPAIANLWKWLIATAKKRNYTEIVNRIPVNITTIHALRDEDPAVSTLVGFWFVKGSPVAASKQYAWARTGKWKNQFWGANIRQRIIDQMPAIKHWSAYEGNYTEAANYPATWFVDPPYQNKKFYRESNIDFKLLAKWCRSRNGQVIVCEQNGASWLPFNHQIKIKSLKSHWSQEVWWER